MECTQRLECTFTQDLYGTQSDKVCPEQIGFLGICGKKYPVKKGPNKIGRDPTTCNIVLNLNSISRQHAVINILGKENFMLMDLDSANKTKLSGKTLQPYIPQPLRNGDTVQFGEIFGIFRLLVEDDLPMTQAIDIPDTPVPMKHMSRINAVTTVPESPDVSDKDDSFIVPSQPKGPQLSFPKTQNFIKPGKTISIQPVGTNKIDNIYWNSSKKSTSLNLDDSNVSLNESIPAVKLGDKENKISNDIHELETQMFPGQKFEEETDSIYSANTQLPKFDNPASIYTVDTQIPSATISPSIHSLNTQLPCGSSPSLHNVNSQVPGTFGSPSVHTLDTQIPGDHLPEVRKINKQQDMQCDIYANERDRSIYNAETQLYPAGKENVPVNSRNNNDSSASIQSNKLNISNDEVLFDEVDQPFEEEFESQVILTEDIELPLSQIIKPKSAKRNMRIQSDEQEDRGSGEHLSQIVKPKSAKRNMRIKSDGSTDCEDDDILPTQKIIEKKVGEDDTTDCEEDNMIELKTNTTHKDGKSAEDFEDMPTQVIINNNASSTVNNDVDIDDMPTQVLNVDIIEINAITEKGNTNADLDIENLPTQVLDEDVPFKKQPLHTKLLTMKKENSPFKIPSNSALKAKKKEGSRTPKIKQIPFMTLSKNQDKYYQDTQDIYEDLCTQTIEPVEMKSTNNVSIDKETLQNKLTLDTSVIDVDTEENIGDLALIKNMTNQEVLEVIGVDNQVAQVKKVPSDGSNSSDVENTPKKQRPSKFMEIDLPDSQEIKTSVSISTRAAVTESSSESETENNSEDQCTPVVFLKKKKPKPDVKLNLTKKFDLEALPTRVITRVRKPTTKLRDDQSNKMLDILKPKFMTEQEYEIDKEIITENISRLKSKSSKSNHSNNESKAEVIDVTKPTKSTRGNHSNKEFTKAEVIDATETTKSTRGNNSNKEFTKAEVIDVTETTKSTRGNHSNKEFTKSEVIDAPETTKSTRGNRSNKEFTKAEVTEVTETTKSNHSNKIITEARVIEVPKHITNNHSNKEFAEAEIIKASVEENVKKVRSCRKKVEEVLSKPGTKVETPKYSTSDSKGNEKRKREPRNTKKELLVSKNQSSISDQSTNQSISGVGKQVTKKKVETRDSTNSPVETKRSTRNRNAKTVNYKDKSPSPEKESQTEKSKRKYTRKATQPESKKEEKNERSPEKEIRRSKRQRPVKEEVKKEPPKSILKKSVTVLSEESAVYNMSSTSNFDSYSKRPSADDSDAPSAKRLRSVANNNNISRATPARTIGTQYVLFTAFPFEAVKVKLEKMGAVVVTDVMQSTVLLTKQIKRTFKLLCAVGLGKPIVGPEWVQACADNNIIVDPWLYLIKDEITEKRFHFNIERTLTGKRNFLKGYNLSSTPSVMPDTREMKLIVECSGGTWQEGGPQWICVSVPDDAWLWPALRRRGATVVSTEFILGGVLRQRVDIETTKFK